MGISCRDTLVGDAQRSLEVSCNMQVVRLARALLLERKMRSRLALLAVVVVAAGWLGCLVPGTLI